MADRQLARLARLEEVHHAVQLERWIAARATKRGCSAAEVRQGIEREQQRYRGLVLLYGDGPEGDAAIMQVMADDVGVTVAELQQRAGEIAVELGWT
jgi:hypothetical protein